MRILFAEWRSLCQYDIVKEFQRKGWQVDFYSFPREEENTRLNMVLGEKLIRVIAGGEYDFVFSFNYFPVISLASNACKVKYVAWVFDSPFVQLYSNTIRFPYNYVFIFDRGTCEDLWSQGIDTVYYLPMAAPVERYDSYFVKEEIHSLYDTEISFIGSTYFEKKNCFYERLDKVSQHTKGYLDACIEIQKNIYGSFILERMLKNQEIMDDLLKACPLEVNEDGFERLEWVYANYFLARHITAMERKEVLDLLSQKHNVDLYTYEQTPHLQKINNKGTAEVLEEAPLIYKCSKINLNISLKSIITGIPLRAFEIMGSGGFLLTNYQADFGEYFEAGVDYEYYEDYEDLEKKVEYYLTHEDERKAIAENGYRKVKSQHTYSKRVDEMVRILEGR